MHLQISFYVPGLPFQGDTLATKSLGGSETAGLCVARELAKRGHTVNVFSNCDRPGLYDGVQYLPAAMWGPYAARTPHDVSIIQRVPEAVGSVFAAKATILWCHDLALGRQTGNLKSSLWNLDRIAVVSDYMRGQYKEVHELPDYMLWTLRNGVDLELFPKETQARDRDVIVYGARPERGLDLLIGKIMPELVRRRPGIKLKIAGYDNHVEHLDLLYRQIHEMEGRLPPGSVEHVGSLPKAEWYKLLAGAGAYVYPTPGAAAPTFRECFCIAAAEAQASGLPIITSNLGALPEVIAPGAGRLIDGDPLSDGYAERFVQATLATLDSKVQWERMSAAGKERAKSLTWSGVAEEWEQKLVALIDENNDDPRRLAVHFIRHSEVDGARALANEHPDTLADIGEYLDDAYGFLASDEAYAEHYRKNGEATSQRLASLADQDMSAKFNETDEDRFKFLERRLANHPEVQTILDYGCGHGWSTIYLHNKVGRTWWGVDVDPGAVEACRIFSTKYARNPQALTFSTPADLLLHWQADAAICSEVLEHVRDPYATLESIESRVKVGGKVWLTVPYGPVEFGTPNWYSFRNHVRMFDAHDLRDMLGKKPRLSIEYIAQPNHPQLGDPCGFWFIQYDADHAPIGRIDMKRKLRLQRPKQTVSAVMIAGGAGAEEHLHSCMRAIAPIADEILVGATNMTPETERILRQYPAQIVPAPNPLVYGFDAARNAVLERAQYDWILWLDTDEKLIEPSKVGKYLRANWFDAYSIRQHHHAVDTNFPPDMPVRLFRRIQRGGHIPKWYGKIHEHPEKGMNEGPGNVIVLTDVNISHPGYVTESIRRDRFARNLPLLDFDRKVYPERLLSKHMVCRDNMLMVSHALERNGGMLTPELRGLCEEVVDICQKHFIGKQRYTGVDTLVFYTQALGVLGRGIEAEVTLKLRRDGQEIVAPFKPYRFSTLEELKSELLLAVDAGKPLERHWW